jgi:hypothetical protein
MFHRNPAQRIPMKCSIWNPCNYLNCFTEYFQWTDSFTAELFTKSQIQASRDLLTKFTLLCYLFSSHVFIILINFLICH